jgi:hypothetical protein
VRTAYEVNTDRDDWRRDGLCRENPDLWTSSLTKEMRRAQHICAHCPVREQCRLDGESLPPGLRRGVVYGGVAYLESGLPETREIKWEPIRCGWCLRGR